MKDLFRIAICGLLILAMVGIACAYTENFQNGADNWAVYNGGVLTLVSNTASLGSDTFQLHIHGAASFGGTPINGGFYNVAIASNYFAFTSVLVTEYNGITTPSVDLLDSGGNLISTVNLNKTLLNSGIHRVVLTRDNQHVYVSYDGGGRVDLGSVGATQPYYWVLSGSNVYQIDWYIDDVVIGSGSTDVVGLPPHTWFVGQDILDPSLKGLFDASYNNIYTNHFFYTISNSTGASVQNYSLGATPPTSGTITITSGSASDYINCRAVTLTGTNISWSAAEYAANDVANLNWTISDQYWDTTTFDYKFKVYEYANGTITLKQTTAINTANGTGTYQTTQAGIYTAALILDYKTAPNTDYWLDSDWMQVLNGASVLGYTYDSLQASPLASCNVSATQAGTTYTTTSDSSGYYHFNNTFNTGQEIKFIGNKTGYQNSYFNYTYIKPGTSQVDFSLIPIIYSNPVSYPLLPHNSTALMGYVTDTSGSTYLVGSTVSLSNGSWSGTYTVPSTGAYIFDNLAAGSSYTLSAAANGYIPLNTSISTGEVGGVTYYNILLKAMSGTLNGTTVAGYVLDSSTFSPITGASVNLSNGTWSSVVSSDGNAFYQYGMVAPGSTYNISGQKSGYTTTTGSLTTGSPNTFTYYNIYLQPTAFGVSGGAALGGYIYDASTLGALPGATVAISNSTWSTSQTSSSPYGSWIVDNLTSNSTYTVSVSKSGYISQSRDMVTGLEGSIIYGNFYISTNTTVNGTTIYGTVLSTPYNFPVANATVTCGGKNTTSNDGGFYKIENLNASTSYTCTCSKSGYNISSSSVTTGSAYSTTENNIYLNTGYTVLVSVKDSTTYAPINGTAMVTVNGASATSAINGVATFSLPYGSYTFEATATKYYSGTSSVVVSNDQNLTIYLTPTTDSLAYTNLGPGQGYPPHNVRFTVQTLFGVPIENVTVTAIGTETTAGTFAWLYDILGISNSTPIANSTLNGTTDHLGQINFMMFEAVKYQMSFQKPGYIDVNLTMYPKDEYYTIVASPMSNATWYQGGYNVQEVVNSSVTGYETNGTIVFLYTDSINSTKNGTVWINQTNKSNATYPETSLYNFTIPNVNATNASNWSLNYSPAGYQGQSYIVRYRMNSTTFTQQIARDYSVLFRPAQINPMGLSDFELMLISVFLIIFLACFFGAVQAPQGPLLVCFVGWILWIMGWMNAMGTIAPIALTLATVVSIAVLIMVRSRKGTWF